MSIEVELLDGRTYRWHVRGHLHRVHARYIKEQTPALRRRGLRPIYRCEIAMTEWWGPRWVAWWLRPLLAVRDATAWSWGRHCLDIDLIRDGDCIPLLPRGNWFRFGWYS